MTSQRQRLREASGSLRHVCVFSQGNPQPPTQHNKAKQKKQTKKPITFYTIPKIMKIVKEKIPLDFYMLFQFASKTQNKIYVGLTYFNTSLICHKKIRNFEISEKYNISCFLNSLESTSGFLMWNAFASLISGPKSVSISDIQLTTV